MGANVFKRRCGCGRILGLRESCAACADRRRAELRASGIAESELWERINRKSEQTHARAILLCLTAPARWAAGGVVGVHRARRDYERKHKQTAGDLTARPFQVGDRVLFASAVFGFSDLVGTVLRAHESRHGDFFVRLDSLPGVETWVHESQLTLIEPAKPRYVDASEVREGDTIRVRCPHTGKLSQGKATHKHSDRILSVGIDAGLYGFYGWAFVNELCDIEIVERAK